MESQVTRVLGHRYELSHLVARGGMAEVYRARDQLLDRAVALKVLFPELSVDRTFVERFRREAQSAAKLSHAHIVPVFDWGEDDGTYFIVMEFVEGRALSSILRSAGPLHPDRAAEIGADVAQALAYAHRQGVIHRDVKPGNVLITDEGLVKVTDFGIARALNTEESLTQTGAVMGTATYFSPEQAEGMGVDARSDIYSLGVVLFEMTTGRPPFLGESPVSVASKHVREYPPTPREINPSVPPDLEAIILKCLAKQPEHRYASGDELRVDLLRFREGRAVSAEAPLTAVQAAVGGTQVIGAVGPGTQALPVVGADGAAEADTPEELQPYTKRYVAILLVLLVALGVVVFFLGKQVGWWDKAPPQVPVPSIAAGTPLTQAEQALASAGFHIRVQSDPSGSGVPSDEVVSTNPPGGAKAPKGSVITILIGSMPVTSTTTPSQVQVPNEIGQSTAAATADLKSKGFSPTVQASSTCNQVNLVCDQNPEPGNLVKSGSTVTLLTAPTTVPVPDVATESVTQACNSLNQVGLRCGSETFQASNQFTSGEVIGTNPAVGTQVQINSSVDLVVSSGPAPTTVPNVIGDTEAQAASAIQGDGLVVGTVTCTVVPNPPANGQPTDVTSQSPASGTSVSSGSSVNLGIDAYKSCSNPASPTTTTTSSTTTTAVTTTT